MDVEILHVDDCPNWELAADRLREAMDRTGLSVVSIETRQLRNAEDAAKTAFAGSPTITFDGTDLFPSGGSTNELACRIYLTPLGLAGLPTVDQLTERIAAHEF